MLNCLAGFLAGLVGGGEASNESSVEFTDQQPATADLTKRQSVRMDMTCKTSHVEQETKCKKKIFLILRKAENHHPSNSFLTRSIVK